MYPGLDEADDAELEDELERLVEEDLNSQFKDVSVPSATPSQKGMFSFYIDLSLFYPLSSLSKFFSFL